MLQGDIKQKNIKTMMNMNDVKATVESRKIYVNVMPNRNYF